MIVLMIRHGRTDWNEARRIQGRTDIPLNERGIAEQQTRAIPRDFADAPVRSSPLVRARQTSELLGANELQTDERLIEMDFGAWEGHTHRDLTAEDPEGMRRLEADGIDMRPPGGETPREVADRLLSFLSEQLEDRLVAVTHKGVIRAAFATALGWDMTRDMPFRADWNAGHCFRFAAGRLELEQANVPLIRA